MAIQKQKKNNGCAFILVVFIFTFIGFVVFSGILKIDSVLISLLLALPIAIFIATKLLGKPRAKSIVQGLAIVLIIFLGLKALSYIFSTVFNLDDQEVTFVEEEAVSEDVVIEGADSVAVYTSHRYWKDNYGNEFRGPLSVREKDYIRLKDHLNSYSPRSSQNFWGTLYDYLDETDGPSLDLVVQMFTDIHNERRLDRMQFAEMIVSCIQDIPYSFVFQEECLPAEHYEASIREILEKCPECCIGNVAFGIQNPVSFIQSLKGDCDSRTVLIYSLLKHFNYDVAILNSDYYRHSILGLNIPARGLHKIYNGKKYVVWETTAKYYEIGSLSSYYNNITHWDVVLTSK